MFWLTPRDSLDVKLTPLLFKDLHPHKQLSLKSNSCPQLAGKVSRLHAMHMQSCTLLCRSWRRMGMMTSSQLPICAESPPFQNTDSI